MTSRILPEDAVTKVPATCGDSLEDLRLKSVRDPGMNLSFQSLSFVMWEIGWIIVMTLEEAVCQGLLFLKFFCSSLS